MVHKAELMGDDRIKWSEDRVREVYELALLGLTDEKMWGVMGISQGTFNLWKRDRDDFREALLRGKILADARVAESLYKRAVGYDVEDEHVSVFRGVVTKTKVRRHVPGDPWSAAKWLSLRQRSLWSETQRMEITQTNVNITKIDYTGMSDEELLLLKKIGFKNMIENAKSSQ